MGKDPRVKIWLICAALIAVLAIVGVAGKYISVFSFQVLNDQEKWGQFGDYFGGVLNPILSFFAFVALLVTFRFQLIANEDSERRHDEQVREQRLFQLVGLMNENALGIRLSNERSQTDEYFQGHQALHHAAMALRSTLGRRLMISSQNTNISMDLFESGKEAFTKWRRSNWAAVGAYIDTVFLILKFVLANQSSTSFRAFSLSLLSAQLSESERLMIWYSALFTAEYSRYLIALQMGGFINDEEQSLDDQLKSWRADLIACSVIWSNMERPNQSTLTAPQEGIRS
ncbi:hypothetical protein [Pseudomonas graminis]|uniref:Phage abortive infection protein n=1 Tax=Pseudomonas graminis TaxID=158627 RepID=A0A1I0JJG9_9PSED|nr:hypothetical protein [Pseudomonas graminis]SEU10236.1 hypothetical protein SAMN05216197_16016 [Pseudomonas graminis]